MQLKVKSKSDGRSTRAAKLKILLYVQVPVSHQHSHPHEGGMQSGKGCSCWIVAHWRLIAEAEETTLNGWVRGIQKLPNAAEILSHTAADPHPHTRSYTCRVRRNLAIKSHFYFGQESRNWSTSISATSVFPAHIHTCRCRTRIPAATCGGGQHSPLLQHFCNGNGKCSIGWVTTSALGPKNHGAKVSHANACPCISCSVYRLGLCPPTTAWHSGALN